MKQAKTLSKQEFRRLLLVVDATKYAERNRLAVALSFFAGLRACEIASVRVGDVFSVQGEVHDTLALAREQTKGSVAGAVPVSRRLAQALTRYRDAYPRHAARLDAPVMFSAKGGGMSRQTVINLFASFYRAAGITGASSHSGRRQFVTELADKGINPRVIQALARHKHLTTTQRYIDVNDIKLRRAVDLIEL
jgi:integrase/recombinase XerD